MKKIYLVSTCLLLTVISFAQPPQAINYQGVARDSVGHPLLNQNVGIRLSILDSSSTGQAVYIETHQVLTNNTGLFNLGIGAGTVVSGIFSEINWGQNNKWLKIEMDASGGSNYELIGVTQFLSVPYALYSANGALWNSNGDNINNTNIGSVGIGTTEPATSAQLEINSTSKGFLPPRMTWVQRNVISNPTAGLIVWCSNCGIAGELQVYNGTNWTNIVGGTPSIPLIIGHFFAGGIIVYISQLGDSAYNDSVPHGLIAAPYDQSTSIQWYNGSYATTAATGTAIWTGSANTNAIVSSYGAGIYAAKLCNDLVLNGYNDWYLPSMDELNLMFLNIGPSALAPNTNVGGFGAYYYWSSTEINDTEAWSRFFLNVPQNFPNNKNQTLHVRAVRAF